MSSSAELWFCRFGLNGLDKHSKKEQRSYVAMRIKEKDDLAKNKQNTDEKNIETEYHM